MTDMTTDYVLEGAAPYDPAEDVDRVSVDAFRKLAAGLRRTAVALANMADGRGFAELRDAFEGLVESAEAADVIGDIIADDAVVNAEIVDED